MTRVRSILCPVDFSEHSRRALGYARALAAFHRAKLTVLTVIDPLLAQAAAATSDPEYLRDTRAELGAFVGEPSPAAAAAWAAVPRLVVTIGHPGDQVLEVAEIHQADLIVMGTQGLGGFRKLVFGSTTERVLRRAAVPVLAVPLTGPSLVSLEAEGPTFRLQRLVVGVDLRDDSTALARLAAGIAREFGASLLMVHVVQPVQATARWRQSRDAATHLHVTTAEAALEDLAGRLDHGGVVETRVLSGHAAEEITGLAVARHAGLIVVGTGAGEPGGHRPGSTAYRVLCLSELPVLAVPPTSAGRVETDRRATGEHAPA